MTEQQTFAYWLEHGIVVSWKQKTTNAIRRNAVLVAYQQSYRKLKRTHRG